MIAKSMTTAEFTEHQRSQGRIPKERAPNDPPAPHEVVVKAESDYAPVWRPDAPKAVVDATRKGELGHPWKPDAPGTVKSAVPFGTVKPAPAVGEWKPAPPKGH